MTTGTLRGIPTGAGFAILAAALFGASTPLAKMLVGGVPPVLLAGLLYLGSGIGLSIVILVRGKGRLEAHLSRTDVPWLAGAGFFGGRVGTADDCAKTRTGRNPGVWMDDGRCLQATANAISAALGYQVRRAG